MRLFNIFRSETRLSDLEDRADALERGFKQLELEWSETFDKVRRTLAKIAKRDERSREDAPGSTNGLPPVQGDLDLNQRIRESRRGIR